MLYLSFRPSALDYFGSLPLWQRERLGEAIVSLLTNPRPFGARLIGPPEGYQLNIADRNLMYHIHKNDQGVDLLVILFHV